MSEEDFQTTEEFPATKNTAQSQISESGNSNVNVRITLNVDVKPIAFAMLYSLFAAKQLTEIQLEKAINRLKEEY